MKPRTMPVNSDIVDVGLSRLTLQPSPPSVISGPVTALPFSAIVTGPVVRLSNGASKYTTGSRCCVSNVILRCPPIVTVIDTAPLVTAMTETTSLTPCAAGSEPPWPHTVPEQL